METPPFVSHNQDIPQAGAVIDFQGFLSDVLCLSLVLIPLVACPWQREQIDDAGS